MSRLAELAQRSVVARDEALERCDMCGAAIAARHRHLLELPSRELRCACRACAILFDRRAAAGGRLRLVPDRRLRLDDFALDDLMWEELRLPVDIAFFFHNTQDELVQAYYPSPMGPTESLLTLGAWAALEQANPGLRSMEPDVEALLVHRALGARRHWLVPIDECYALVGIIRSHWKGLTGGKEVWQQIARFYDELDRRSRPVSREDTR